MAQLKASTVKTEEKGGGPHHHSCTQPLDTALTEFTMLIKTAGPSLFFLTSSTNTNIFFSSSNEFSVTSVLIVSSYTIRSVKTAAPATDRTFYYRCYYRLKLYLAYTEHRVRELKSQWKGNGSI